MPDGRTALETIESVAARSRAIRVPMGNGGKQMWHVWGEGSGKPTLLLFHGGSGSWIHWIRNVLPLSQHFEVYAADMPGLGDSDPPDDVRDIWSVTHCVKTAVEALLPKDKLNQFPTYSENKKIQWFTDGKWWVEHSKEIEKRWNEFKLKQ